MILKVSKQYNNEKKNKKKKLKHYRTGKCQEIAAKSTTQLVQNILFIKGVKAGQQTQKYSVTELKVVFF